MRKNLAFAVALSAAVAMAGCGDNNKKNDQPLKTGAAKVALSAAELAAVDHVALSITGGASPITQNFTRVDSTHFSAAVANIPAGTYTFAANAYADAAGNTVVLTGHAANVAIVAGQTAAVSIILRDPTAPIGDTKRLPIIDGLSASSAAVDTGAVDHVSVTAHSPDNHALTYQWSDTCAGGAHGTFASATDAATGWTAPATGGVCQLAARVIDATNVTSVTAYMIITVNTPVTTGSANVVAVVDTYPMLTLGAADAQIVRNNPPAGLTVGITADVVASGSDADGSPVTYAWTSNAGCPGTFAPNATSGSVTFHSDDPNAACTLTLVVADSSTPANTITATVILTGERTCANVTCPVASDACHVAGACDPATLQCTPETVRACAAGETCSLTSTPPGQCVPVVTDPCVGHTCPAASDACHVAGTCSSATGAAVCSPETAVACPTGQTCSLTSTPPGQCVPVVTVTVPVPQAIKSLSVTRPDGIAVDSAGAVYVTEPLTASATFDGNTVTSAGASDVLLVKYDPATHNAVWARNYGDSDEQYSIGVAVTQDGTVVSLGNFLSRINGVSNTQTYAEDFLMGVDPANGNVRWTNAFNNGSAGAILSIATNPSQNIIAVCGYSSQASDMVTGATYGGGSRDAIVAVYRSTGEKVWAREIGGAGAEQCSGLAVDAAGDVYAVGRYNAALDLGPGSTPVPTLANSLAVNWTWVAKFRGTDGQTLANTYIGGRNAANTANSGNHTPSSIAVDSAGNVVIAGSFTTNMRFPTTPETSLVSAGSTDAFIAKFDPTFASLWAVRMGGSGSDGVTALALGSNNDVLAVGIHNGTTTGVAELSVPAGSAWPNAFILKLDGASGARQFAQSYGDADYGQTAAKVAVRGSSFAVLGSYTGTIDFGSGLSLTSADGATYVLFGALQ